MEQDGGQEDARRTGDEVVHGGCDPSQRPLESV